LTQAKAIDLHASRGSAPRRPIAATETALGRVPPHDLDAEAAVLSSCLLRGAEAVDEASVEVSCEEFYSEAHRRIFEAAVTLAAKGQPVDAVTVASELKDRDRLGQVGGMSYLHQILDAAPAITTEHLVAYARKVREKARLRALALKLETFSARCYGPLSGDEAEAFFGDVEREVGDICAARHTSDLEPAAPIVKRIAQKLDALAKSGSEVAGVRTGFSRFDRSTGGLHGGDLTIIAARPGMGKTSFVLNIGDNVSDRGHPFALWSLEMPKEQLILRQIAARARIDVAKARTGQMSPLDWQKFTRASTEIFQKDFHVDDGAWQTLATIRSKARRFVNRCRREGKPKPVLAIDYLQLIETRSSRNDTRATLIGEITRGLKRLAKELDVPVLLLSQLNRSVETRQDKRPMMSDLRESGEIEQDADNIVFIYRDDYYFEESEEPGIAELLIVKQRNGPTGTVKVRFDKQWTRFDNLEDGEYDGPPVRESTAYVPPSLGANDVPEPPAGFLDDFLSESEEGA